ncbi:hypothetical protein MTR67_002136 [Solanum verrucosum]|uniref:Uncharacterized protein n=1 Tax=Solanum verrucosum TaxID=315347 RepID=A0AAF0T843_SOLVR|nr:hypothetical protein MTR67_002136 [Solanum verrucosum]
MFQFAKTLCDLGSSKNLMPYKIFNRLWLSEPKPKTLRLLLADHSIKRPIGILYDILEKVEEFIFPADILILDCKLMSRSLLFSVGHSLLPERLLLMWKGSMSEVSCVGESLAAVLLNYDRDEIQDYYEVVAALLGLEYLMEVFMDDFLVVGDIFEVCLEHLGHKILVEGIPVDPAKVEAFAKFPPFILVKGLLRGPTITFGDDPSVHRSDSPTSSPSENENVAESGTLVHTPLPESELVKQKRSELWSKETHDPLTFTPAPRVS